MVRTVAERGRLSAVRFGGVALAALLCLAAVHPDPTAPGRAGVARTRAAPRRPATGRIEGTVEISNSLAARRPQFRIYAEPGTGSTPPPPPRDPLAAELKNVVVYLEGDSTTLPAPPDLPASYRHGSMSQRDQRFTPHVLPILQGGTVDFPNDDNVYHNVFSLSSAAAPGGRGFDLGRYPNGASKSWTFTKAGTVQVFCHIHSDMNAVILVLANPYFASPDDNHRFTIDNVPEGDYTIVGWHERIKPITRTIHVVAGQTTSVDFNIPLPQGGQRG